MSGWVHPCYGDDCPEYLPDGYRCNCTTPTPDAASPCGRCGTVANNLDHDAAPQPWGTHRHQPTRCTCGHSLVKSDG